MAATGPQNPVPSSVTPTPGEADTREPRRRPVAGAPWLPRHYTPRRLLWSQLEAASNQPVTIVVAPAGAGKTLGVAGWLATSGRDVDTIWYDATRMTTVELLRQVLDRAATVEGLPLLVVVDDAHLLSAACVRLVDERLSSDPYGLRLVLLTRWDLSISRLVPELLGHLTILRGDVLRLTREESISLATQHAGTTRPEILEAVVDRSEGWCAALVLAARASATLPAGQDAEQFVKASGQTIADLVAGEVFVGLRGQERHLLLCVAGEPDLTTELARHLTRDPQAGEALDSLETTGLLVNRVSADLHAADTEERYRIHPLLLEVVRRRMVAGGVDVQQARATILRATRLDLGRGLTSDALRRFLALGEYDEACAVLAEHGPRLLARDERCVDGFLRQAGASLEEHPETWGVVAWSRWTAGDDEAGRHWADRLLRHEATHPGTVSALQHHSLRLHRSRSGADRVEDAVSDARHVLDRAGDAAVRDPYLARLLLELGVAENWLGRLTDAEEHLSDAVLVSRSEELTATMAEALSHLALTHFMLGREQPSLSLATQTLALLEAHPGTVASTRARAQLVQMLVWFETFPLALQGQDAPQTTPDAWRLPTVSDDLTSQFWRQIMQARLALLEGSAAGSLRALDTLAPAHRMPEHLRICALMERAGLAVITADRAALRTLADTFAEIGAQGEQLWAQAAADDVDGDLQNAASLYREAAAMSDRVQPPTGPLSMVSAAQLLDYLGDTEAAHDLLVRAVDATGARRLGSPFLGWSRHGTRVGQLLGDTQGQSSSGWATELREACADRPGIASLFAPTVATEHELASVTDGRVAPNLSPRELEVLQELARGSTYSDAAANLFVSENTVKTHVSSLYGKLSVGRRSEALAVARKLHLI